MATKKKVTGNNAAIRIGDRVYVTFGSKKLSGKIVEFRGAIGRQGQKLYRVTLPMGTAEDISVELPENEMIIRRAKPSKGTVKKVSGTYERIAKDGRRVRK
ncbi:MAG: hypothetical protein C0483_11465 [Pirellula sp.]|nr:hypothetical protein [Pirellula sp.]